MPRRPDVIAVGRAVKIKSPTDKWIDRVVRELIQLGRDDAMIGSKSPEEMEYHKIHFPQRVKKIKQELYSVATGPA